MVTGRPCRISSSAICTPLDDAPTTRTPPSGTWPGLRYSWAVSWVTPEGTPAAAAGTVATLQAPDATTTASALQPPPSVSTR